MRAVLVLFIAVALAFFTLTGIASAEPRMRGFMLHETAKPADLVELEHWNVNLVRYPLHNYHADIQDEAAYMVWLDKALLKLDQVISSLEQQNIKVLIDLHSPPGGYAPQHKELPQYKIFSEKWAQTALRNLWITVATRYKDNPTVWGYELLNEPAQGKVQNGLKGWNQLARRLVKDIRKIDPAKKIVVNPQFADVLRIHKLKPIKGKQIYYSVHMYYPHALTHQGYAGYPLGQTYPKLKLNKAKLKQHLKPLDDFQRKNKAKILIHEFSIVRWAPNDSAYRYLRDLISIFESHKWHWIYHEYRGIDGWSVEYGEHIDDSIPSPTMTTRESLLRKYFDKNKRI